MALIICSECGKEISDKASACVHCGCPVSKPNVEQKPIDLNEALGDIFGGTISGFDGAKTRTVKTSNEQKSSNDVNATAKTSGNDSLTTTIISLVLGVACLIIESDVNFLLFGMIPLSVKTIGAIFLVIGIITGIVVLAKKKK